MDALVQLVGSQQTEENGTPLGIIGFQTGLGHHWCSMPGVGCVGRKLSGPGRPALHTAAAR
eukprot:349906-Chlamydomonas_euryale.AAC.11